MEASISDIEIVLRNSLLEMNETLKRINRNLASISSSLQMIANKR